VFFDEGVVVAVLEDVASDFVFVVAVGATGSSMRHANCAHHFLLFNVGARCATGMPIDESTQYVRRHTTYLWFSVVLRSIVAKTTELHNPWKSIKEERYRWIIARH